MSMFVSLIHKSDPDCLQPLNEDTMYTGDCDENGEKTIIISCGPTESPTKSPTTFPTSSPTQPTISPSTDPISYPPTKKPNPIRSQNVANTLNVTSECINFFGGGDVHGTNCEIIEALVWLIIAIGVVSFACCCVYFCCNQTARKFIRYGRMNNSDDEDDDHTDGYITDEDTTPGMDHPRVLIEPNGLNAFQSGNHRNRGRTQSARKASIASRTTQSTSDTDTDSHQYRKRGILDISPQDEIELDPLDTPENDNRVNSLASNVVSSFHPFSGPTPSQQGFIGCSSGDDYNEYGSKPNNTRTITPMTRTNSESIKSPNDAENAVLGGRGSGGGGGAGAAIPYRHIQHIHPSKIVGRTIEIENVEIDVLAGVDISAMHPMGNQLQIQDRNSNSHDEFTSHRNDRVRSNEAGLTHGTLTSALEHSGGSRAGSSYKQLAPPGSGHNMSGKDNDGLSVPEKLEKQASTRSDLSVNSIVRHYIHGKSFFADHDAKASHDNDTSGIRDELKTDGSAGHDNGTVTTRLGLPKPANSSYDTYRQQHTRQNAMDMDNDGMKKDQMIDDSKEMNNVQSGNDNSAEVFRRERNAAADIGDDDNGYELKIQSQKGPILSHLESPSKTSNSNKSNNDSTMDYTHTLPPPPPIPSTQQDDNKRNDNNGNYGDDWDTNDANQLLDASVHGALSSALAHSVDSEEDIDADCKDDPIGSLPSHSHGALTSALGHSVDSRPSVQGQGQNLGYHHMNNSLIDPLIDTPISHDALSSALAHSVIDSTEDNDEENETIETGTGTTGTVTSALRHSINTRLMDQDDSRHINDGNQNLNDEDNNDENHSYRPHASSSGTVHDL